MAIEVDYFHRDIRNLLGLRNANIAFESRVLGRRFLPPFTTGPIQTFGPFYEGALRRAGHQLQQALQPPLPARRQLHLRAGDRQFARDQFAPVRQLRRHGAGRHRNGDRPIERQRRIHPRQRHARAGGRDVPERTRSRQGTVRSGDRSRAAGQRHGRTAVPDSGQRHLPGAERLPLQPGIPRAACWSIPTATRR